MIYDIMISYDMDKAAEFSEQPPYCCMLVLNPWFALVEMDVELHQVYHHASMNIYKYIHFASIIVCLFLMYITISI